MQRARRSTWARTPYRALGYDRHAVTWVRLFRSEPCGRVSGSARWRLPGTPPGGGSPVPRPAHPPQPSWPPPGTSGSTATVTATMSHRRGQDRHDVTSSRLPGAAGPDRPGTPGQHVTPGTRHTTPRRPRRKTAHPVMTSCRLRWRPRRRVPVADGTAGAGAPGGVPGSATGWPSTRRPGLTAESHTYATASRPAR